MVLFVCSVDTTILVASAVYSMYTEYHRHILGLGWVSIGNYRLETTFTLIVIYIDINLADTCEIEVHLTLTFSS